MTCEGSFLVSRGRPGSGPLIGGGPSLFGGRVADQPTRIARSPSPASSAARCDRRPERRLSARRRPQLATDHKTLIAAR